MRIYIYIIFFLFQIFGYSWAQKTISSSELLEKADNAYELLKTDKYAAFELAQWVEDKARENDIHEAELKAILTQYVYYRSNSDLDNMLKTVSVLNDKSEQYKILVYHALAQNYFYETYEEIGLPEKGIAHLQKGLRIINQSKRNDELSFNAKAEIFINFANYYVLNNDTENQLKYIKLAGKEFEKIPDKEERRIAMYVHNSNLGEIYRNMGLMDLAKSHVELSHSFDSTYGRRDIEISNLMILGDIALSKNRYKEALEYFKKVEAINFFKSRNDRIELYDNLIKNYQALDNTDSLNLYKKKMDSLNLEILRDQNSSLRKIYGKLEQNSAGGGYFYLIIGVVVAVLILTLMIIVYKRNVLIEEEKRNIAYLDDNKENQIDGDSHAELITLLRENNPSYLVYFEEIFPDFKNKLMEINPEIIGSDVEFCSFLKLKIETKDIAKYKFIAPKTVQNKRYLIRKKLNIPKEMDTYEWFDKL